LFSSLCQGDKALWSLSCTCGHALRKARAPEGSSTPFHVFLNPTPSTEDVIKKKERKKEKFKKIIKEEKRKKKQKKNT
jgi:hypothetical protein